METREQTLERLLLRKKVKTCRCNQAISWHKAMAALGIPEMSDDHESRPARWVGRLQLGDCPSCVEAKTLLGLPIREHIPQVAACLRWKEELLA